MARRISDIKLTLKQPWLVSVLFAVCIPLFPEYLAPFLAVSALITAHADAKSRGSGIQLGLLGKLLVAYIAFMAIGILYSAHPLSTLSTTLMWVVMLCVYLAMTTVLNDRGRLDTALFCICLVAGLVGLIGVVQYLSAAVFGMQSRLQFWWFIDREIFRILPMDMMSFNVTSRPSATFNNPNIFAEYLMMALPFVAYYAFDGRRSGVSFLCRGCFVLSIFGIAVSFSRGSYLSVMVILAVFCIANIRKILIILMSFVSACLIMPQQIIDRLLSVSREDVAVSERLAVWTAGLERISSAPLFGIGAGISNSWEVLLMNGIDAPHMHNIVLQLLLEGGVISLGIMCAMGWMLLRTGWNMLSRSPEARALGVAVIAFVAAFCTHGMVDFPLLSPKLVGIFVMILAIGDIAARLFLGRAVTSVSELVPTAAKPEPIRGDAVYSIQADRNEM